MQSLSNEQLMMKYAEGHTAAFTILYNRHRAPLFRYLLRQMGNQHATVEELYQEIWTNIINSRQQYIASAKFTTYLYKIAHNKMVDYFRRNSVRREVEYDQEEELLKSEDCAELQQQTHWKNCIEQLLGLIKNLPQEQREAFILRHEGDHNIDAIAEITGVNQQTAKSRLRYAMRKLRNWLSDDCL